MKIAGQPSIIAQNILELDFESWIEKVSALFRKPVTITGKILKDSYCYEFKDDSCLVNIPINEIALINEGKVKALVELFGFKKEKENKQLLLDAIEYFSDLHNGQSFSVFINYPAQEPKLKK